MRPDEKSDIQPAQELSIRWPADDAKLEIPKVPIHDSTVTEHFECANEVDMLGCQDGGFDDSSSIKLEDLSDASTIDNERRALPPDLQQDCRFVNPRGWLTELKMLEEEVVNASASKELFGNPPSSLLFDLQKRHQVMEMILSNFDRMQSAHYCNKSFNAVIACSDREDVAALVPITKDLLLDVKKSINDNDFQQCYQVLRNLGFTMLSPTLSSDEYMSALLDRKSVV